VAERLSFGKAPEVLQVPNLIKTQIDSFEWFKTEGLRDLFAEISPIDDFTRKSFELTFHIGEQPFGKPKYSVAECRERDITFSAPLRIKARLLIKETGEIKEQEIFIGDFPMMTEDGTFVINGTERVVVSQLVRSPGVYFTLEQDPTTGRQLCMGKVIPNRGAWLEFETSNKDVLTVKVDRKRKIPITTLLRAINGLADVGLGTDEQILRRFEHVDTNPEHRYVAATLERDTARTQEEALLEVYRRIRPGDPPTLENAKTLLNTLFFNPRRYDLGRVGRYKVDKRLRAGQHVTERILTEDDIVRMVEILIKLNNGEGREDDIDHLGNRRVRAVGELLENQFRVGLLRMERVIREKMTIQEPGTATPGALINIRPVVAAMKEFFGGSQLSQFMDQTNPLAELHHKRRLSALGPGGLSRERAGFDVRDVHHSHYGRICPIETPEGPNIGLIGSLATFCRINEFGFIETPYRPVINQLETDSVSLQDRTIAETVVDEQGKTVVAAGMRIDAALSNTLAKLPPRMVKIVPAVSTEVKYLTADEEEIYTIAQANSPLNEHGEFLAERISGRHGEDFVEEEPDRVDYMDVSPRQIVGVSAALIPFLEHDDANRALMGSNMQRQAVPLLVPASPVVGTGMEARVARDSGHVVLAQHRGTVTAATARKITIEDEDGESHDYPLTKFVRSNSGTCINQRPIVNKGDVVKVDDVLADSQSTQQGELALGDNVLVAFMFWEGGNYEDAIILSERIVQRDQFTSIHIEKHEVDARDTKLGPEEITKDLPNVSEEGLRNLDERGIVYVGADVEQGDILVGKITPKGETELTAEERLLRAIFGEKAREVKDTSLRVPHGERGKVVTVKTFSRDHGDELPPGVNELVRVSIAQKRKVSEGDKMAGRHGNKGVISRILPIEDMPFLADGTPVDIILNPLGAPARMNLGQVLETHLGWAMDMQGRKISTPVFDSATEKEVKAHLGRAWLVTQGVNADGLSDDDAIKRVEAVRILQMAEARLNPHENGTNGHALPAPDEATADSKDEHAVPAVPDRPSLPAISSIKAPENELSGLIPPELERELRDQLKTMGLPIEMQGKMTVYDGRTGEMFAEPVAVGTIYMMKLIHLVEDKIHARSTGPYSMITQQPLGGKAQFGGQRFGEMEVWALEAYGAAHILQELLTVKSDDIIGRVKTYEAIVKGESILEPGVPESFKVLVKELQSLGLAVEVLNDNEERVELLDGGYDEPTPSFLEDINLSRPERY
jgi:DNA-directed RNA polymerase subunit beta